jgi:hypothetical protein
MTKTKTTEKKVSSIPNEIIAAITFIAVATLLGITRSVLDFSLFFDPQILIFIAMLPYLMMAAFLIFKILSKRKWARTAYLVLVTMELFLVAGHLLIAISTGELRIEALLSLLEGITAILAVVLLFSAKATAWIGTRPEEEAVSRDKKIKRRKATLFLLLAAIFIIFTAIWLFASPEEILHVIGINNGYILAFVVSFFAGFSAFTAVSFYSLLIAFITGGLNPWLLALITGTSLALGDMFLFYFGRKGRDMISGKVDRAISNMTHYLSHHKLEKFIPLFSYLYISFIPLPNDWLLIFLASIRYPQKNMNIIIIFGDYTHVTVLTFLIMKGIVIFG